MHKGKLLGVCALGLILVGFSVMVVGCLLSILYSVTYGQSCMIPVDISQTEYAAADNLLVFGIVSIGIAAAMLYFAKWPFEAEIK